MRKPKIERMKSVTRQSQHPHALSGNFFVSIIVTKESWENWMRDQLIWTRYKISQFVTFIFQIALWPFYLHTDRVTSDWERYFFCSQYARVSLHLTVCPLRVLDHGRSRGTWQADINDWMMAITWRLDIHVICYDHSDISRSYRLFCSGAFRKCPFFFLCCGCLERLMGDRARSVSMERYRGNFAGDTMDSSND